MFAGPNGSGKSTLKSKLEAGWLGVYVNADEIEDALCGQHQGLDLSAYGVGCSEEELRSFLERSALLQKVGIVPLRLDFRFDSGRVSFRQELAGSYLPAVLADFIRRRLVASRRTLSFETVMSGPDKVAFFCQAQRGGYRTYLYFVATEDPEINKSRIALRVQQGGHGVPDHKVIVRYSRSLDKLIDAIRCSNRAYIFDNSGSELLWLAEVSEGREIELKVDSVPQWFNASVLEKISSTRSPEG